MGGIFGSQMGKHTMGPGNRERVRALGVAVELRSVHPPGTTRDRARTQDPNPAKAKKAHSDSREVRNRSLMSGPRHKDLYNNSYYLQGIFYVKSTALSIFYMLNHFGLTSQ